VLCSARRPCTPGFRRAWLQGALQRWRACVVLQGHFCPLSCFEKKKELMKANSHV